MQESTLRPRKAQSKMQLCFIKLLAEEEEKDSYKRTA